MRDAGPVGHQRSQPIQSRSRAEACGNRKFYQLQIGRKLSNHQRRDEPIATPREAQRATDLNDADLCLLSGSFAERWRPQIRQRTIRGKIAQLSLNNLLGIFP